MAFSLNPNILFENGKKLIEDGNLQDAFRFALSGKEPFEAMKKVFSSVTTLELHRDCYSIGWGNKCCTIVLGKDKPQLKNLMNQIGSFVEKLHLDISNSSFYQSVIDKIIAKKQLVSISISVECNKKFLDEFLPTIASTLKDVTIPDKLMTSPFCETMNLETLTVLNPIESNFAYYCCKTSSLKLLYESNSSSSLFEKAIVETSPRLSSIKELHVDRINTYEFEKVMKYMPSLELFNYTITCAKKDPVILSNGIANFIQRQFRFFNAIVKYSLKLPSKVVVMFCKADKRMAFPNLEKCKEMFPDFEFDESNPCFYICRKVLQRADTQCIFEVHFSK